MRILKTISHSCTPPPGHNPAPPMKKSVSPVPATGRAIVRMKIIPELFSSRTRGLTMSCDTKRDPVVCRVVLFLPARHTQVDWLGVSPLVRVSTAFIHYLGHLAES